MSLLQQGLIVVDGDYELATDRCKDPSIDSKTDYSPGVMLAFQAIVGTVWWVIVMVNYSKNALELKIDNVSTVPLVWAFMMLTDPTYGWTAASVLANFLVYGIVSVPELIAWIAYLFGEN